MREGINRQKIVRILTCFYLCITAGMVMFNTVNSLLRTTYFELYKDMETAKYRWDNPILVLVGAGLLFVILYLVQIYLIKAAWLDKVALCFGGMLSLTIVLIVRTKAICDGETLSNIAIAFMQNNYEGFCQGEYLYNYSFQLGMTAVLELIYRWFGVENYLVFQWINVVSIVVFLWMLNKITKELFEEEKIQRLESALSMGMLPLFLFSTFVYGDVIGWALGISAVYNIIRYLKTEDWRRLPGACILLAVGVVVKSNINILVVAAVIALLLHGFYKKHYRVFLWAVVLAVVSQLGVAAVQEIYVRRANLPEYPAGIPKIAWVAMSFQETDEGGYACGWYNGYNWDVYRRNGYDRDAAANECLDDLKRNLGRLLHEQRYALNFIYKKFTSQWNAPTFQAMISNEWGMRHTDNDSVLAHYFVYGRGRDILYGWMNIYHFFMFLCTALFFVFRRKYWSLPAAYFILNIFGGFLFHMIWEAQSRYILGYFVLLLPLAACGCSDLTDRVRKVIDKKAPLKRQNGRKYETIG